MEKNKHMIGNMPFEEFNKLSYREQCDYLSTLKPIATEGVDDMPLRTVEIDCSFEEYAKRYHLVSLAELQAEISEIWENILLIDEPVPEGCEIMDSSTMVGLL